MSAFLDNVEKELKAHKITKNKMLSDLNLSRNSFVDWRKRGTIPSASVVSAIAEYLGTTVGSLMGFSDSEEELTTFPSKFCYQLAVQCKTISDVSQYLGITDSQVLGWITGGSDSYEKYMDVLSDFFEVVPRYWTSPGMVSPGIEPNTEEYLLVLLYREYRDSGNLDEETYGTLEHYFPGIHFRNSSTGISTEDRAWLDLIHELPRDAQIEFRGEMKGYIKCMSNESVAAESQLKQAK